MAMSPGEPLPSSRTVLLLVDFVNPLDFPGAEALAGPALDAARAAVRLKRRLADNGVAAVFANDNYGAWHCNFGSLHGHCEALPGAPGEIARMLSPAPDDLAVLKPRHSAFLGSPLDLLLTQMGAHVLVVTGLATDICVQLTAMDASLRGYSLWIPEDCTAAESPTYKADALAYARRVLRADTRPSTSQDAFDAALSATVD